MVVDEKMLAEEDARVRMRSFKSRDLLSRLLNMGLVEIPIEWYRQNPNVLEELREGLLVSALYQDGNNSADFTKLNAAQRERCIINFRDKLPQEFSDLERLEQRLKHGDSIDVSRLSLQLKWLLAKPIDGLPAHITETVWRLMCRVAQVRLITQFSYDKEEFFAAYSSWPEPRKLWAVETILRSGLAPRRHV
jgi:hypothetical protein